MALTDGKIRSHNAFDWMITAVVHNLSRLLFSCSSPALLRLLSGSSPAPLLSSAKPSGPQSPNRCPLLPQASTASTIRPTPMSLFSFMYSTLPIPDVYLDSGTSSLKVIMYIPIMCELHYQLRYHQPRRISVLQYSNYHVPHERNTSATPFTLHLTTQQEQSSVVPVNRAGWMVLGQLIMALPQRSIDDIFSRVLGTSCMEVE